LERAALAHRSRAERISDTIVPWPFLAIVVRAWILAPSRRSSRSKRRER
jgi:hypothetical protein